MLILQFLLGVPLLGALFVALAGRVSGTAARVTALITMLVDLALAYALVIQTRGATVGLRVSWIPSFGVNFSLQADWLSSVLILLTTFLGVLAVSVSWREIKDRVSSFHVWLLLLQVGVMLVFLARDLMLFYLGWELMLVPVLFLIGSWGTGRKEYSAFKFVLFTFTGSIFMLMSFLYVYFRHQSQTGITTFELDSLLKTSLTAREQWWVFLGLLIGFGVKAPLVPLHTWLIDAYPSAPTAGSLLLAGILSKTGVYGLLRFAIPLAPEAFESFKPLLLTLALIGIFYGAYAAFSQVELKRLIAYSSLSHVGFILLGLFLQNGAGFKGSVLQMVNHGLTTAALFIIAGIVQERMRSRDFELLGGLWGKMPALGGFFLFFSLASLGIPGTGNFVGELLVVGGAFQYKWWIGTLAAFGVFLGAIYSLKLFTATMHGPLSPLAKDVTDAEPREALSLAMLATTLLVIGFFPQILIAPLQVPGSSTSAADTQTTTQVIASAGKVAP